MLEAFYAAAQKLKNGVIEAIDEFPFGCFPPAFPFRPHPPDAMTVRA
jgi:hypothetical protein